MTADAITTGIALLATAIALASVRRAGGRTPVAARMVALLAGLALLLSARLLAWTGSAVAAVPLMMVAAWLPMLALLVAEHLVRRHAAMWLKWLALAGAVGFTVVAILFGAIWDAAVLGMLAVFQAIATLCIAVTLLSRRSEVSTEEARLATLFAAVLLIAVPLAASDFRDLAAIPVRGGAFAALLLVLAITRFVAGTASGRSLTIDVVVTIGGGALVAIGSATLWPGAAGDALMGAAAIGAATTALAMIVQRRGEARLAADARPTIVAALAGLPDRTTLDEMLSAHPLLASGRSIDSATLALYPPALVASLAERRVVTRADGDGARDLLDAQAATHLVRLRHDPPRFLAVSAGGLGGDAAAIELDMVARLAENAR